MINKVEKIKKIKYCYHLADLHIRNLKRHKEYREVLNKFLNAVDADNLKDAVIFLGGDIAHAKLEMSPELVREITWFLSECANRLPTYVITGNHDCNLNNKDRLDVLTPICENLNIPNLYYLRDTGVYEVTDDTSFAVYSILDHKTNWPKASDIKTKNKICLFHGPVDAAKTDIGYVVSSHGFSVDMFDGFDLVMMGDIHKRQIVQERNKKTSKPIVVYCGSTVQQNHGEYLENHGYLLWNFDTLTFTEHNIHNDYGYLTIDVINGVIPKWVYDEVGVKLPKYPRLRVRFADTDVAQMKSVSTELQKLFKVSEITISRQDALSSIRIKNRNAKNLAGNVKDISVQNQLIRDYLERQFLLDDKTLDKIIDINNVVNTKIQHEDSDTALWIPKSFEFDNMFSYGEDNRIDFTKASGIVGLFAPNTSGKSALWDALSFCIFDKCSRAFKATHIMNNQKDNFKCRFNFEVDGIDFFIERIAKTTKSGKVKVDVQFWKEENGVVELLNGDERRDTNDVIRKYLGTYEDFVMTSLSLQGNNALFIDKSQTERKDVLAQYMGVNVFDKLFDVINEDNKENAALLKSFKKEDHGQKLAELDDNILSETTLFNQYKSDKETIEVEKLKVEKELILLESQIKNTIGVIDIADVESDLITAHGEIVLINEKKLKMQVQFDQTGDIIKELKEKQHKLTEFFGSDIQSAYDSYNKILKQFNKLETEISIHKGKISVQNEKLVHLSKHEYDPNCKFCVNNVFVKDAIETKNVVLEMEAELDTMMRSHSILESKLSDYNTPVDIEIVYKDYIANEKELNNAITLQSRIKAELMSSELKIKSLQDKITSLNLKVDEYNKNKEQIELNIQLNKHIDSFKSNLNTYKTQLKTFETKILKSNSNLSKFKTEKCAIQDMITKVRDLEEQNKLYDYYLDAVKRDGVSYELISKTLPSIEGEINNILGQIVEFQMNLQMDGKNVNAFIVYGDDRMWPLEMCSGMERFISGLAIRIALINICNLPRPNFLVIDEGFGTLDAENLQSLFMAFAYLKTQFDFVVIISHIDSMRDVVDNLIEIKKDNGFSSVQF
jgi:DNA repair exonuclease SbcCD ATPase subunit